LHIEVLAGISGNYWLMTLWAVSSPGAAAGATFLNIGLVSTDANAGGKVVWLDLNQGRHHLFARLNHVRAASMKTAGPAAD